MSQSGTTVSNVRAETGKKQTKRGRKRKIREEQLETDQAEQSVKFSTELTRNG